MLARHHHLTPATALSSHTVMPSGCDPHPLTLLVVGAQRADAQALEELVTAHLPLLYAIVRRAMRGHSDVDDVVQETLLRVVRGLRALRDPVSFRAWLIAIAMRQVTAYRRRQRTHELLRIDDDQTEIADPSAHVQELVILRLYALDQGRQLVEASRWLDSGHRALFAFWWQETTGLLDRGDVAAAVGLSVAHAGVRLQRMHEQLELSRAIVAVLEATPRCPQFATVVAEWDGRPSSVWRKRIGRHLRSCTACGQHTVDMVPVRRLPSALSLLPMDRPKRTPAAARPTRNDRTPAGPTAGAGRHNSFRMR